MRNRPDAEKVGSLDEEDVINMLSAVEMEALCRGPENDSAAYFEEISTELVAEGTQTTIRWHRIAHDGTKNEPDVVKLSAKLIKLLTDFACTRAEAAAARDRYDATGSCDGFAELQEKARRLFTKSSTTGEPGELLLYFLAERQLGYPQILCKFPLKTNPNVHAHGADGVHASVDVVTGHLRLHWGEAKFHASIASAIDECFESLAEMIVEPPDAGKTSERDIELLRDNIELNNESLEEAICKYLDPDDPLSNKLVCCGVAVIGFDLKTYSELTEALTKDSKDHIGKLVTDWTLKIKDAAVKHKVQGILIDVFCVPCVSVEKFRSVFLKRLGVQHANSKNTPVPAGTQNVSVTNGRGNKAGRRK